MELQIIKLLTAVLPDCEYVIFALIFHLHMQSLDSLPPVFYPPTVHHKSK